MIHSLFVILKVKDMFFSTKYSVSIYLLSKGIQKQYDFFYFFLEQILTELFRSITTLFLTLFNSQTIKAKHRLSSLNEKEAPS